MMLGERFWSKVAENPDTGCWEWTGGQDGYGYGSYSIGAGRNVKAHRVAFEEMRGPIPDALVIDHLCRVRNCVNPWHMEPVTRGVNVLRGVGMSAYHFQTGLCARGHEMTPENSRKNGPGKRVCRICRRASQRALSERNRRAATAA